MVLSSWAFLVRLIAFLPNIVSRTAVFFLYAGISGLSDSRDLEAGVARGDPKCVLAVEMFCYRVAKYIAAFSVPLGGSCDALVFTGGIGEKSSLKRAKILGWIRHLGLTLDPRENEANALDITGQDSKGAVLVIPTDEELLIARETLDLIMAGNS